MRIAIHHRPESFSVKWLEYCDEHRIDRKVVNCFDSDIVNQLEGCDGLMWHWPHWDDKAILFARQLTYSLERKGFRVFPDSRTCWHYDDKVGQKYLLEALGAPLVPSYVFYDKARALGWIETTAWPKVFKLRRGAGAANVSLVRSKRQARRLARRAFGRGFSPVNRFTLLRDRAWHLRRDKDFEALAGVFKGLLRVLVPTRLEQRTSREKNYVYFQDFVADNPFDMRIVVIGSRAFGLKRMVRSGDFRASGSGLARYEREEIDVSCLKTSFEVSRKIGAQCLAFDYVFDSHGPLLVEMSYAFPSFPKSLCRDCPGYWDEQLGWHEGKFYPEWFMIEDFIRSLETR